MKHTKIVTFFIILMLLMTWDIDRVLACRCAQPESLKVYQDRAALVFTGEVVEIGKELPESKGLNQVFEVKFKVLKWWKGGNTKEIIILDTKSTCSPGFEKGKKWLVYAVNAGDTVGEAHTTNVCDGTLRLKDAKEHLKVLGAGKVPVKE